MYIQYARQEVLVLSFLLFIMQLKPIILMPYGKLKINFNKLFYHFRLILECLKKGERRVDLPACDLCVRDTGSYSRLIHF